MANNTFRKLISLFLSLVLIYSTASTAFAAEETPTEEPTSSQGGETAAPEEPNETEETVVAKVSVFMAMYVFPVSAHSWLYVENLTDSPLTVGLYEVPAGQGVSVGTFSFSVRDGWGIYYNLEAYRENKNDRTDKCWSITVNMTRSELEELSNSIKNYPNMWDIFIFNCTFFSFSIWNAHTNYFIIPFMIPAVPWIEMMIAGAEKGTTPMYYPTTDQVMRQRGTGNSAYLEPVGENTINN